MSMDQMDRGNVRDAMQERIDDILAAHGGDARSAIEMLLIYGDGIAGSLSFGYVRGRIVTEARLRTVEASREVAHERTAS